MLVTTGDGTTSEGEFWESLNTACNLKLPVVYLVEDNGYAISVPVEVNTAGGSISKLVAAFPDLYIQEVDGCDLLAQLRGDADARSSYARAAQGPGARAREGHPPVLALAVRRRDACTVRRRSATRMPRATRSRPSRSGWSREGHATEARARGDRRTRWTREVLAATDDALVAAAARRRHGLLRRVLARRRPDERAVRHRGRSAVLRRARRRWSTCSTPA